ncbi:MAG: DUF6531 domain-containing protein, partial [Planctomycetes bacterium]|nr:DUF6531 domain-containing protein [Planctomycetota bacterium]
HFGVSGLAASYNAGDTVTFIASAFDIFGNQITDYEGDATVTFGNISLSLGVTGDVSFSGGVADVSILLPGDVNKVTLAGNHNFHIEDVATGVFSEYGPFTVTPGAPFALTKVGGDNQLWGPLQTLPDTLDVRVTDEYGNFLDAPGIGVTYTVTEGSLSDTANEGLSLVGGGAGLDGDLSTLIDGKEQVRVFRAEFDSTGELYLIENMGDATAGTLSSTGRIRKITPAGILSTVIGTGVAGHSIDGTIASEGTLIAAQDLTFDPGSDEMYFSEDQLIRKLAPDGFGNLVIETVAGQYRTGSFSPPVLDGPLNPVGPGGTPDGNPTCFLHNPQNLDFGASDRIYFLEWETSIAGPRLRVVDLAATEVRTLAGGDPRGIVDGSFGTSQFYSPRGLTATSSGVVFITDSFDPDGDPETNNSINYLRIFNDSGTPYTFGPMNLEDGSGGNVMLSDITVNPGDLITVIDFNPLALGGAPTELTLDSSESELALQIQSLNHSSAIYTIDLGTFAGDKRFGDANSSDPAGAGDASTYFSTAICYDPIAGTYVVADNDSADIAGERYPLTSTIRELSGGGLPTRWTTYPQTDLTGLSSLETVLFSPRGIAVDDSCDVYITDAVAGRIYKVDSDTLDITVIAGTGEPGNTGDGGPATDATLQMPSGIAIGVDETIYFTDTGNGSIRAIDPGGTIYRIAGSGGQGYSIDGEEAFDSLLSSPTGIFLDDSGNIYFCDTGNGLVRLIDANSRQLFTVAGSGNLSYDPADEGELATDTGLIAPTAVAVSAAGEVFIADTGAGVIWKVGIDGKSKRIAGGGLLEGAAAEGAPATDVLLAGPIGLALDREDPTSVFVYVAESGGFRVRRINLVTSTIETEISQGTPVFIPGVGTDFSNTILPIGVAITCEGNLLATDVFSGTVVHHLVGSGGVTVTTDTFGGAGTQLYRTASTEGQHIVDAISTGLVGTTFSYNVDATPPDISLNVDPTEYLTSASPTVVISYTDNSGAVDTSSLRASLDDSDIVGSLTITASDASFTPALDDGSHAILVSISDQFGNATSAVLPFWVDTTPPTVSMTPTQSGYTGDPSPKISFTLSDGVSGVDVGSFDPKVYYQGNEIQNPNFLLKTPGECIIEVNDPISFTSLPGQIDVVMSISDSAGNTNNFTGSFFVVEPVVVFPSSPTIVAGSTEYTKVAVTLTNGTEPLALSSARFRIESGTSGSKIRNSSGEIAVAHSPSPYLVEVTGKNGELIFDVITSLGFEDCAEDILISVEPDSPGITSAQFFTINVSPINAMVAASGSYQAGTVGEKLSSPLEVNILNNMNNLLDATGHNVIFEAEAGVSERGYSWVAGAPKPADFKLNNPLSHYRLDFPAAEPLGVADLSHMLDMFVVAPDGIIYSANQWSGTIVKIDPKRGTIEHFAGKPNVQDFSSYLSTFASVGIDALDKTFFYINSLHLNDNGDLWVSDNFSVSLIDTETVNGRNTLTSWFVDKTIADSIGFVSPGQPVIVDSLQDVKVLSSYGSNIELLAFNFLANKGASANLLNLDVFTGNYNSLNTINFNSVVPGNPNVWDAFSDGEGFVYIPNVQSSYFSSTVDIVKYNSYTLDEIETYNLTFPSPVHVRQIFLSGNEIYVVAKLPHTSLVDYDGQTIARYDIGTGVTEIVVDGNESVVNLPGGQINLSWDFNFSDMFVSGQGEIYLSDNWNGIVTKYLHGSSAVSIPLVGGIAKLENHTVLTSDQYLVNAYIEGTDFSTPFVINPHTSTITPGSLQPATVSTIGADTITLSGADFHSVDHVDFDFAGGGIITTTDFRVSDDGTMIFIVTPAAPPGSSSADIFLAMVDGVGYANAGTLEFSEVERIFEPRRNASSVGVGVIANTGEFIYSTTTHYVSSRGMDFAFGMTYRSKNERTSGYLPLGIGWDFGYNERLEYTADGDDMILFSGSGRYDVFTWDAANLRWTPPPGYYSIIRHHVVGPDPDLPTYPATGEFFVRETRYGTKFIYGNVGIAPDSGNPSAQIYHLIAIVDRNQNRTEIDYSGFSYPADASDEIRVLDTLGRTYKLRFGADGHISYVFDFVEADQVIPNPFGEITRGCNLTYDTDHLKSITTQPTQRYVDGFTTVFKYEYEVTAGLPGFRIGNLYSVTDPKGQEFLINTYDEFDRVTDQTFGEKIDPVTEVHAPSVLSIEYGAAEVEESDRNGNLTRLLLNPDGTVSTILKFANRCINPDDPALWKTTYEYNSNLETTRIVFPRQHAGEVSNNSVEYTYDESNTNIQSRGNLIETRRKGTSDAADDLVTSFSYAPMFNLTRSVTNPRGYTSTYVYDFDTVDPITLAPLTVPDQNGSGGFDAGDLRGNVVIVHSPDVTTATGSPVTQTDIRSRYFYDTQIDGTIIVDTHGMATMTVDPENRISINEYEFIDYDGIGSTAKEAGYLIRTVRDPSGVIPPSDVSSPELDGFDPVTGSQFNAGELDLETLFLVDERGNVIASRDPNGNVGTRHYNDRDQVHRVVSPAVEIPLEVPVDESPAALIPAATGTTAVHFDTFIFYDPNGNVEARLSENVEPFTSEPRPQPGYAASYDDGAGTFMHPNTGELTNPNDLGEFPVASYLKTTYMYDILNLTTTVTEQMDAAGSTRTSRTYRDDNDNAILSVDPTGDKVFTEYDERNMVYRRTLGYGVAADESVTTATYNANGSLVKSSDPRINDNDPLNGGGYSFTAYDGFDRVLWKADSVRNSLGEIPASSSATYDGDTFTVPESGDFVAYTYDENSNVLETVSVGYTDISSSSAGRERFAHSTSFYDELDRSFRAEVLALDADGNSLLEPSNLSGTTGTPGINRSETVFHRNGLVKSRTDDNGATFESFYDGANRSIASRDPLGNITFRYLDNNGNSTESTLYEIRQDNSAVEISTNKAEYDSLNRAFHRIDTMGFHSFFWFDSRSNTVRARDPEHHYMVNRYDFLNRNIEAHDQLADSVTSGGMLVSRPGVPVALDVWISVFTEYHDDSTVTSIKDDLDQTTAFAYDSLKRKTFTTFQDGGIVSTTYDSASNPITYTDQNETVITNTIHPSVNLITDRSVAYANFPHLVGADYESFRYDGAYRMISAITGLASESTPRWISNMSIDTLSQITSYDTWTRDPDSGSYTQATFGLTYSANGNLLGIDYPNNGISFIDNVSFHIDKLGRTFASFETGPLGTNVQTSESRFVGAGRVIEFSQGGDSFSQVIKTSYDYETSCGCPSGSSTSNRLTAISVSTGFSATLPGEDLVGFKYAYDRLNLRVAEERTHEAGSGDVYVYDAADRMTEYRTDIAAPVTQFDVYAQDQAMNQSNPTFDRRDYLYNTPAFAPQNKTLYNFDSLGNRTTVSKDSMGSSTSTETYTQNGEGVNEYGSVDGVSYSYDSNGNLIDDGKFTYTYNFRNQLTGVYDADTGAMVGEYGYDAFNRRVFKKTPDETR